MTADRTSQCPFCLNAIFIDFKETAMLSAYLDERGKLRSGRETGLCVEHQMQVARAVKRARELGLLPR